MELRNIKNCGIIDNQVTTTHRRSHHENPPAFQDRTQSRHFNHAFGLFAVLEILRAPDT